jgi:pyruvate formate lyase activating enzyme
MGNGRDPCVREAMQYRKAEDSRVECFLCAHRCKIAPGKRGICQVRENRDGTLYALVYGRLVSAAIDPIEKKPLFHVLPGSRTYSIATMGCNFKCAFCQNSDISQISGTDWMEGRFVPPQEIVEDALRRGCPSISYTYTEPTIFFEYAHDCAVLARQRGLKNVFVTNGYQTPETIERMAGLIDAANVDLKAGSDDFYRRLCKARLQPVLDAIRLMHQKGIFIEVTTLLIPDENDSDGELEQVAAFLAGVSPDIPWHVSAFFPRYKMTDKAPTAPKAILRALEIGRKAGIRFRYAGNVVGPGFEDTLCPACGKVVIQRTGYTLGEVHLKGTQCAHCGVALPMVV